MKVPQFIQIYKRSHIARGARSLAIVGATLATVVLPMGAAANAIDSGGRQAEFTAAAHEFNVPENVLLAISYDQTRWEDHQGQPSAQGGYGVMHLTTNVAAQDGRGDSNRPMPKAEITTDETLDQAATQLQVAPKDLQKNDADNIRGAAAVLSKYAKELNNGQLPDSIDGWYAAIAKYSGATTSEDAQAFADDVFSLMQHGVSRTTSDGQHMNLAANNASPRHGDIDKLHKRHRPSSQSGVECPTGLNCRFVPAAYAPDDPNDKTNYGNYDNANRPKDMKVQYIVIHDTEGSYDSAISGFQDPTQYTSAHYVIRSSDGAITQMVPTRDVAWHAGNWQYNMNSIGIEHEGFAAEGGTWYTESMYQSSAKLVRYLAAKYNIPLDRQHIIGHEEVPGPTPGIVAGMHTDPGAFWDWSHYMDLLHAPIASHDSDHGNVVTINPNFATNKPNVTDCSTGTCTPLPSQGASFVYLHTQPDSASALLSDIVTHPGGGTTDIADMSAKASAGEAFAVADHQGDWTAIWYGGQKGWFLNPDGADKTATHKYALTVKPKGSDPVAIYGRAYPEASAYPSAIPIQNVVPLQYTMPTGQHYTVAGWMPTAYYYASTIDSSAPQDHTVVIGHEKYVPISYNHRQAFVKASDIAWN
jgi:N-acetyl-anhydromuramyl-L-alanine amidase AmpD